MLELHRLPVSDLLAQLQLLIVLIVLLLVLLEQQHLRDVLVNLLYLLLDFDQRRLAHLLFASLLLDELLEALRRLLLLFEQLPLPQIGAAVLLDFDSEEALFEAIAAILAQVVHLWDHFDALIGDAIRVERAFVDEVRLRKAPQSSCLLLASEAHVLLHRLQGSVVVLLSQVCEVDLLSIGEEDHVAHSQLALLLSYLHLPVLRRVRCELLHVLMELARIRRAQCEQLYLVDDGWLCLDWSSPRRLVL